MKKRILPIFTIFVVIPFLTFAFDADRVHPEINSSSANISKNLANTLVSLNYIDALDSEIYNLEIKDWFRYGGTREDDGNRYLDHFHDPTQSWAWAGLKNNTMGDSSMFWAQSNANDWSWRNARTYLYSALTHPYPEEREKKFALTFRALGQVMHLLADASVPAHVRDDIHVFPLLDNATSSNPQLGSWTYETWCKHHSRELELTPAAVPLDIKNLAPTNGFVPISHLWDTTPDAGPSVNPLGLAEYTNRNFFSKDTVFKDYPQPQSDGFYVDNIIENGEPKERVYFKGTTSDGKGVNHLASTGYLYQELIAAFPDELNDSRFILDDECFKDYAAILVPKAVGYSAALLDYFFRGDIEMVQDGSDYTIKNNSDETMNGTFTLYYDADDGQRKKVPNAQWTRTLAAGVTSSPLTVEVPEDADPDGQFVLVFQGALGNETGAVVGRVVKIDDNSWSYLIVRQTKQISPEIPFLFDGKGEFGEELTFEHIYFPARGNQSQTTVEWEVEFLGSLTDIVSINIDSVSYSRYSCHLSTKLFYNENSSNGVKYFPISERKGVIIADLKRYIFSPYITVTTRDKNGQTQRYSEPIFIAYNHVNRELRYEPENHRAFYNHGVHSYFTNNIVNTGSCVDLQATYIIQHVEPVYIRIDIDSKFHDHGFIERAEETYHDGTQNIGYSSIESWEDSTDDKGTLPPKYPYYVIPLKVNRTWRTSVLKTLESFGYDTTKLPRWDIYVDTVRSDYRP